MKSKSDLFKEAIQKGIDELESGQYIVLRDEKELHEFFENIKREGKKRLKKTEKLIR